MWTDDHIIELIFSPKALLIDPRFREWIDQRGGLEAVYALLRGLPLAHEEHNLLRTVLGNPGQRANTYAYQLGVERQTFYRHRAKLIASLQQYLAQDVLKPVRRPQRPAIPRAPTPLIGRAQEIDQIKAHLAREHRIITLLGPGGAGKTRLALHMAQQLQAEFPDGIAYVPLSAIEDGDMLPLVLSQQFSLQDNGGAAVMDQLIGFLADQRMLLILDNFEQLIPATGCIADIVALTPAVSVLVTSRQLLQVYGEYIVSVPALPLPPRGQSAAEAPDPALLAEVEAVKLFLDRAGAVQPSFRLTADNSATIAEICQRLDGLPLALELAAARMRHSTPQALLGQLDMRLETLGAAPRAARGLFGQQRSLQDTIAWSYQLLEPAEQALFVRLAVFRGGCSIRAVEEVCAGADTSLLGSLADKSLLLVSDDSGEPRYRMLQTIREFASAHLDAAPDSMDLRRRHALYHLRMVETAAKTIHQDRTAVGALLDAEQHNLRIALQFMTQEANVDEIISFYSALMQCWYVKGRGDVLTMITLDQALGRLAYQEGDYAKAQAFFEENIAYARQYNLTELSIYSTIYLCQTYVQLGKIEQALARVAEIKGKIGDANRSIAAKFDELMRGLAAARNLL
ncbi:MAG TPA: NB-ARC domain-containing protein [Herpetosiphonaceae bacterium]